MLVLSGLIALLVIVLVQHPANADCEALLQGGVFDNYSSSNTKQVSASFANWFCDQNFSNAQSAENMGASLGLPIGDIPVQLGFDSNKQSFQEWQHSFCSSTKQSVLANSAFAQQLSEVSAILVDGFNKCISRRGLNVWLEQTADPYQITFASVFVTPTSSVQTTTIEDVTVSRNLDCGGNFGKRGFGGLEIGPEGRRVACTRTNDDAIYVTVAKSTWEPNYGSKMSMLPIPGPTSVPAQSRRMYLHSVGCQLPQIITLPETDVMLSLNGIRGGLRIDQNSGETRPSRADLRQSNAVQCFRIGGRQYRFFNRDCAVPAGVPVRCHVVVTLVPDDESCTDPSDALLESATRVLERNPC